MKQIELWRFRYFDTARKRYSTTSYLLTEEDARIQFPDGAEKVSGSLEVRRAAETRAEFAATLQVLGNVMHRGPR